MFDPLIVASAFLTIVSAVFIAELTDKDALLLLTLATKHKPWFVFAAGSIAFTITSAIIVTLGYFLVNVFPVSLITIAGGAIMIGYGTWSFFRAGKDEREELRKVDESLSRNRTKSWMTIFLTTIAFLVFLDLAGDATEILTIIFVARFQNVLLVFTGAVCALVAASALETLIGNRLSKVLTPNRVRTFSLIVFLVIGIAAILTTLIHV